MLSAGPQSSNIFHLTQTRDHVTTDVVAIVYSSRSKDSFIHLQWGQRPNVSGPGWGGGGGGRDMGNSIFPGAALGGRIQKKDLTFLDR